MVRREDLRDAEVATDEHRYAVGETVLLVWPAAIEIDRPLKEAFGQRRHLDSFLRRELANELRSLRTNALAATGHERQELRKHEVCRNEPNVGLAQQLGRLLERGGSKHIARTKDCEEMRGIDEDTPSHFSQKPFSRYSSLRSDASSGRKARASSGSASPNAASCSQKFGRVALTAFLA